MSESDDRLYRRGVGVMLINEHRHVFVGRRIDNRDEAWQMPQGGIDEGEESWSAALRELEEETGYRASELEPLCQFLTSPGFTNELMHVFVARNLMQTRQNLQDNERIKVEIMDLDDAIAACADGRVRDGKTIAALLVYHHRQRGS